ncbi:hypothetical protein [Halocatena pleomorpha]|uniref:Uncharacterized protein n=1 Tax=Halocatena pleomorpha TaxID=1785090 RepID=A0A3P3RF70_9EURY|nr:hypothetical protein [Halocatena pleomorpha]RRJ32167.1 hypothetical protein EIK79_05210 [Halocatena pleomorpha]
MQTSVIGSDRDERYWFRVQVVARQESYRQLYGVPARLNPWAMRARSQVTRYTPHWDDWTPRAAGFLVDLFQREAAVQEHDGRYEYVIEYVGCVVAETRSQAQSRLETHLKHGSFHSVDLHEIDAETANRLESTSATTQAIEHQIAVHPLIDGEYTPHVPEIHLSVDAGETIIGVVRLVLSREQLTTQIARAREYRKRAYGWGRFNLSLDVSKYRNERLLAILNAVGDNDHGALIGSVSLTETPDVALALVLSHDPVEQLLQLATRRTVQAGETAQWNVPLEDASLDRFLTHAERALETEAPTVVGPSQFLDADENEPITVT